MKRPDDESNVDNTRLNSADSEDQAILQALIEYSTRNGGIIHDSLPGSMDEYWESLLQLYQTSRRAQEHIVDTDLMKTALANFSQLMQWESYDKVKEEHDLLEHEVTDNAFDEELREKKIGICFQIMRRHR